MICQKLYFTLKILNIWSVHIVLQINARSCIFKVYETYTTPCFPSEQRNFPADIAVSRDRVSPEVHLLLNSPIHSSNFDWALRKEKKKSINFIPTGKPSDEMFISYETHKALV